jgi:hypothetical protein
MNANLENVIVVHEIVIAMRDRTRVDRSAHFSSLVTARAAVRLVSADAPKSVAAMW